MSEQCCAEFNKKHLCITEDLAKQLDQKQKAETLLFRFRNLDKSISRNINFQNQLSLRVLHCLHFRSCPTLGFYKGISQGMWISVCPATYNLGFVPIISEHLEHFKEISLILHFSS